ncbi:MAG: tetratricopeptide repeat protein [Prosthecobacter sp.]|uniref:tetratricopeptide repeat protein n=1 Tax=Prosthecobacter sp. TaxID=1965333 RepID=UPI0025E03B28|nr:tetratricopeptide repeat protein [Prosthecobacter sp.]MCF7787627.1 tetratricopeptide repeat protein [Prosthecobacter sp.]
MAIAIEAFTVVVRNEAVQHRYPGGAEAFLMNVPNNTFCADDSLSRVDFMVESDAKMFFDELESLGLDMSGGKDAVICDAFHQEIRPDCDWLQMGKYKQGTIAWIEGEEVKTIIGPPGWDPEVQRLNYATIEEAAKRLKYLRNDDNVQVFWDTVAEREVFVGRTQVPLDMLFQQAGAIVTANLRNPGSSPAPAEAAIELQRAIEMLETVVERAPDSWRAHWMLGKAWHALGKSELAFVSLSKAFELEKQESVIPRELCGICLELGRGNEAVRVSEHAIGLEPQNPELLGNLAIAHLIDGKHKEAETTIDAALKQNQNDPVNQALRRIITEVVKGRRTQPRNLFDLTGARKS